jgi:imidazolonepropionase-like amidohydrolase
MSATSKKTLVVRNGTLIDGSGKQAVRNDAIVIEGNRIRSVGALPGDVELDDRRTVEVIDVGGQWIMPGLIDAHCQSLTAIRRSRARARAEAQRGRNSPR